MESRGMYRAGFFPVLADSLGGNENYKEKLHDLYGNLLGMFCQQVLSDYKASDAENFMFMSFFGPKRNVLTFAIEGNEVSVYVSDRKGENIRDYITCGEAREILDEAKTLQDSFKSRVQQYAKSGQEIVSNAVKKVVEQVENSGIIKRGDTLDNVIRSAFTPSGKERMAASSYQRGDSEQTGQVYPTGGTCFNITSATPTAVHDSGDIR